MERTRTVGNLTALFFIVFVVIYNAEYVIMEFDVCASTDNRIRVLYGLSFEKCVYECGRRPGCQRLNYRLARKECGLYNESHSIQSDEPRKCDVVSREEFDPDQQLCKCKIGMACQKNGTCQYEECPPIPQMDPKRGVVKGNMQNIGAKVKVQCNEGYTRIPDKQPVVCGNDGQWGEIPDCLGCPSVPQLDHGVIEGNMQNIGATVRVLCNDGYTRVPDHETVVCGNDRQWGVFPECLRCPSVPQIDPTRGVIEGNNQTIGATVRVLCNEGHTRVPDNETVVCGNDGQWGVFPDCLWNCSEPCTRLKNTSDVTTGGTLEGDTRNYTCRDGNIRSQNISIVCSLRGWVFGDISSQLCVNDDTYPNYLEHAVILRNCMILEFKVDRKIYEESREQCSRYGDLVRVDTAEKQNILQEYMDTYHYNDYNWHFIQGHREGEEWRFSDGTQIGQPFWAPGEQAEPSSNCITISRNNEWMWSIRYCSYARYFICEFTEI